MLIQRWAAGRSWHASVQFLCFRARYRARLAQGFVRNDHFSSAKIGKSLHLSHHMNRKSSERLAPPTSGDEQRTPATNKRRTAEK